MSTPWTGADIARLKRLYPVLPRAALMEQLAPRTWKAICIMAWRLELNRPLHLRNGRDWKSIAAEHIPMFNLPTDVPIPYKRPWS